MNDLDRKIKDLLFSEFTYDLSKYDDEGEEKVNNVTANILKMLTKKQSDDIDNSKFYCGVVESGGEICGSQCLGCCGFQELGDK